MALSVYDNAYFPAGYSPHRYWAIGYWPILIVLPVEEEVYRLLHPPSRILKQYIEDESLVGWPVYASEMPAGEGDFCTVYDTTPVVRRRVHRGMFQQHYGLQVSSRIREYADGASKMKEVMRALEIVQNATVSVDEITYRIKHIFFASGVLFLGLEPETKRRNFFSLNLLCVIVRVVSE